MRAQAAASRSGSARRTLSAFSEEPRTDLRATAPILPSVAVMEIVETLTVLVVDGGSTAAQLRGQGFETVEAPNGAVALIMAAEPRVPAGDDAQGLRAGGVQVARERRHRQLR